MTSEQDKRIRKVIKSYYAGETTAEECRKKLEAIFNEPTFEEFFSTKREGLKDFLFLLESIQSRTQCACHCSTHSVQKNVKCIAAV